MAVHGISSSDPATLFQQKKPFDQINQQVKTIDLLRRVCAVAESHTNAMGIILMSTLPILACMYHPPIDTEDGSTLTYSDGHLLKDRDSQERALAILMKAQSNYAALTPHGTNDKMRRDWGWADSATSVS